MLLVELQIVDARADVLAADAVVGEHDLVTDVDAREARGGGEDLEQVAQLTLVEWRHLGPLGRHARALFEVGAHLAGGHPGQRAIAHARRDLLVSPL